MREHPIPQDITGYRFHIIGSMTLKQFGELAAGAIVGLIIYATNLPDVLKWPLIFFAFGLGAAAAFLPFEERPLDHWIVVFFSAMYRPTKFFWKRQVKTPDAFTYQPNKQSNTDENLLDLTPVRRQRIHEYLASVEPLTPPSELDLEEANRINSIMSAFQTIQPAAVNATKDINHKPNLKVRTRSLQITDDVVSADNSVVVYEQAYEEAQDREMLTNKFQMNTAQLAKEVAIPEVKEVAVTTEETTVADSVVTPQLQQAVYVESTTQPTAEAPVVSQDTTFNSALPFPTKPTEPNKLVGMVLTTHNELIPETIVEVRDENNRVVRAVKSNALGQFFISTPLKNGTYTLHFEHDDYQFQPTTVELKDSIMDPIEVRSAE